MTDSKRKRLEEISKEYKFIERVDPSEDRLWLVSELKAAWEREEKLVEALKDFQLGHEHGPDLSHTRALGDTYGWCDYCLTKVSWGPGYAEQALADHKKSLEE